MASTKFVKKFERKSKGQTKDEFFVAQSKINIVSQYKEKVERMYHIDVEFEDKAEDGQWLNLVGEPVDRRNAKNYITALCNPGEVKQIQFPSTACADFTDPKILEQIEKQTNAVIKPLQKVAHFETSGTELAVTLAMSLMEELCGSVKDSDIECMGNVEEIEDVITISPATHNASNRLASVLKRALSQHSDGVCSMVDYEHAPASVQRVLVNCLQDTEDVDIDNIDDDLLFNDGNATNVVSDTPLKLSHAGGGEQDTANSMEVDGPQQHQISPGVGALSDKLTEATISKPPVTPLVSKQHDYLHSFGVSVGYKSEEVNEALQFVDEKTRPSDFLDLLGSVKKKTDPFIHDISNDDDDDVVILETETIDLTEDTPAAGGGHGASANLSDSKQGISLNADLPDGYKERLIMDFFQEDDNCSRDELKRRNAERQQLLRQNFKQQQQQKTKESGCKQTQEGQNAGKKKGKTKSQRKKQQKLNQQQQQQQQQKIENQKEKNDSQHDKQLRLDSSESQTFSNDDDQTCVFRLWNNGEGAQSGKNSEPIFTTPKRKKSQSGNNQRSNTQPITAKPSVNPRPYQPEQLHNPQVTNTFNQWSQPLQHKQNTKSHLPSRDNQWKPMQVVNPVNNYAGPSQPRPLVPPRVDGDELRYIVIDGSNVAMTHGNGKHFSCKGLRLCVDYFKKRGHTKITVFVPQWRTYRPSEDNPILDQHILHELKDEEILVFTPSRRIGRRLVVAYDDRFVLELAEAEDGIIVSNDQYRDLMTEKTNWRKLIEERLLMFSYVGDRFMPPNDPLGRDGPCLDDFLRKSNKQQYSAMGRPLMKNRYQYGNQYGQQGQGHFNMPKDVGYQQGQGQVFKTPVQRQYCNKPDGQYYNPSNGMEGQSHNPGQFKGWQGQQRDQQGHFNVKGQGKGHGQQLNLRSDEETEQLFKELRALFPETDQEKKVRQVLENHEREKDLTKLSNYCINVLFQ